MPTVRVRDINMWCSPACSEEIARLIPGARLKLYPGSSHFFLNEHFDACMPDILRFLRSVPA